MRAQRLLGVYRLLFAFLTLAALTVQLGYGLQRDDFVLLNFFSFFTIESNLLAMLVFFLTGVAVLRSHRSDRFTLLRGAVVLYMTTTGVAYYLLLRGLEDSLQTPIPWVNLVLHYLMPLAVLGDWFVDRPRQHVSYKKALVWLLFPVLYVAYSLLRGPFARWYPYPFLNPLERGYAGVALTSALMLAAMAAFAVALAAGTRRKPG